MNEFINICVCQPYLFILDNLHGKMIDINENNYVAGNILNDEEIVGVVENFSVSV